VTFLLLITVFVALACLGMPLLALAAFMAFGQERSPAGGRGDVPEPGLSRAPGTGPAPFTS
jgi:hypothetical protein